MTGSGLRLQLDRLRRAHKLAPLIPSLLFRSRHRPPAPRSSAATRPLRTSIYEAKTLRGWCFGAVHRRDPPPPLLYKHLPGEVGVIDSLSYDSHGALIVKATVTDEIARRCNALAIRGYVYVVYLAQFLLSNGGVFSSSASRSSSGWRLTHTRLRRRGSSTACPPAPPLRPAPR